VIFEVSGAGAPIIFEPCIGGSIKHSSKNMWHLHWRLPVALFAAGCIAAGSPAQTSRPQETEATQQKNNTKAAAKEMAPADAIRSATDVGLQNFVRLRFSRSEADEIARIAPAEATFKTLDFDASRDTVLSSDLGQYRIVHFATKQFYEGMLARGERPAAALRAAQVSTWKTRGWDALYYRAAFTLQGEWW
jgi:CHAT domain-containing protein